MPFFHHLTWLYWKCLVSVSSNPKTLSSYRESVLWGYFVNFWVIFGYIWEELFSRKIGKIKRNKKY